LVTKRRKEGRKERAKIKHNNVGGETEEKNKKGKKYRGSKKKKGGRAHTKEKGKPKGRRETGHQGSRRVCYTKVTTSFTPTIPQKKTERSGRV